MRTIDMTPSWTGILPGILDAYANLRRQQAADRCDGAEDEWCTVHDSTYTSAFRDRCEVARNERAINAWRANTSQTLDNLTLEFHRMAQAADKWNEYAKQHASEEG